MFAMYFGIWLVLTLSATVTAAPRKKVSELNRRPIPVLLISMDGFRYDYLDRVKAAVGTGEENAFEQLKREGAWAPQGIRNAFSTVTFPNHYTMATGLFEESHGIVGSTLWVPSKNRTFKLAGHNDLETSSLYGGEPIWQTYATQRGQEGVACYMWVGCSLSASGRKMLPPIRDQIPFNSRASLQDRADKAIQWLKEGKELVLIYFNQPDKIGHRSGPASKDVLDMLLRLNRVLGSLLQRLKSIGLGRNNLNIILTSDHGMFSYNKTLHIPRNDQLFRVRVEHYSHWLVDPLPGKEEESIEYFNQWAPSVKVYRKKDLPARWHYTHSPRVTQLVVVGRLGVNLQDEKSVWSPATKHPGIGQAGHGYDNANHEMRPFFIANGPSFKKGNVSGHFHNVNIYGVVCKILGLVPAPNNGSQSEIDALLLPRLALTAQEKENSNNSTVIILIVSGVVASVLIMSIAFYAFRRRKAQKLRQGQYSPLNPSTTFGYDSLRTSDQLSSSHHDS